MAEIRRATPEDVPTIVEMGARLHATGPWADIPFDMEAASSFAAGIIEQRGAPGVVFLTGDGMCGGSIFPMWAINPAFRMATEFFWWAPSEGSALRAAFEEWAMMNGASAVLFSALSNDRLPAVTRLYRMAGYLPGEMTFAKRLAA